MKKQRASAPERKLTKRVKPPSPKWDLYRDGLSQSLISRFIECRETYRLYAVEGMRERGIRRARDYGTIFHKIIELHAMKKNVRVVMMKWVRKHFAKLPEQKMNELLLDVKVALLQYDLYAQAFSKKKYNYIHAEPQFKITYQLPSGRNIILRGRMDEIIQTPRGIMIQENKTKQRIDMLFIENTLRSNLQTMLYALAAEKVYNQPVIGVVYNVIRQPGLRLKNDTEKEYLERIKKDILKRKSHYFQRRVVELLPRHHREWRQRELNPLLEHIVLWWESIKNNPFDPWVLEDGSVNALHFQRPFGIYSPMSNGRGDFYEYKVTGKRTLYDIAESAFEELEEDDDL